MDWALSGPIPWKDPGACLSRYRPYRRKSRGNCQIRSRHLERQNRPRYRSSCFHSLAFLIHPVHHPRQTHRLGLLSCSPGFMADCTDFIENQIERFAPGFKNLILKKIVSTPRDIENRNRNFIDGDITGGITDLKQFLFKPMFNGIPTSFLILDGISAPLPLPPAPGPRDVRVLRRTKCFEEGIAVIRGALDFLSAESAIEGLLSLDIYLQQVY